MAAVDASAVGEHVWKQPCVTAEYAGTVGPACRGALNSRTRIGPWQHRGIGQTGASRLIREIEKRPGSHVVSKLKSRPVPLWGPLRRLHVRQPQPYHTARDDVAYIRTLQLHVKHINISNLKTTKLSRISHPLKMAASTTFEPVNYGRSGYNIVSGAPGTVPSDDEDRR
ncbi:hypothetical protein MHUMG1_07861 [Metarhizium humberi]|uniref:Uncharacterized protein n=1 Tax=Metarhizium humberi TaxID=2596975 RepID=A0A9P8M5K7_9HYPO|nr:hypothetical protein MHUMG1_07861 [Metarhizium humberi]